MNCSKAYLLSPGAALATLLWFTPTVGAQEVDVGAEASAPATGIQWSLRLEPALAAALTDPQSELTEAGFAQTVKVGFGLTRYLEIGPTIAFTTLPAVAPMADAGTAWAFGGGARLMRPRDAAPGHRGFRASSPWMDADLLYVRTGELDRPGFSLAAGVAVPIDQRRRFWIGPFVRYFQVTQGERADFDNRDAKILSAGISLEVGSGLADRPAPLLVAVEEVSEPAEAAPMVAPAPASDRDGDGVDDAEDTCPDVVGPAENGGCPVYEKVAVLPDKLEVKEKIAFKWDSAELEESSSPALDEVAQALKDNPRFRVEVAGHASSDGEDSHNQVLSEQRATAVVDYLAARGIARDRLIAKGFSSSVPAETNKTAIGRQANRRVEFIVYFIILNEGSTP